jgi:hypothetical protein
MLPKTLKLNMYVDRDQLKMCFKNILIQLTLFNVKRDEYFQCYAKAFRVEEIIVILSWSSNLSLLISHGIFPVNYAKI